jgi:transcriptional regulator with XRE-family HTH domain
LSIDWKAVGRRIRESRGFDTNQAEMAHGVGVGQSHLSAIERGKKERGLLCFIELPSGTVSRSKGF